MVLAALGSRLDLRASGGAGWRLSIWWEAHSRVNSSWECRETEEHKID